MSSLPGCLLVQAPASAPSRFADLLAAAADGERQLGGEGVLSLALPLPSRDPLALLPHLPAGEDFRFLWDSAPGLCLAASGRTNCLDLSGPRRFELAQRFCAVSLGRLAAPQSCPPLARPRVLLAFGFFDSPLQEGEDVPGVQAVLPRWQLSRQGRHGWLRLQRNLGGDVTARSLAEELWERAQQLQTQAGTPPALGPVQVLHRSAWQEPYRQAAHQALALVEDGRLDKLVLAVRQQLELSAGVDPLAAPVAGWQLPFPLAAATGFGAAWGLTGAPAQRAAGSAAQRCPRRHRPLRRRGQPDGLRQGSARA